MLEREECKVSLILLLVFTILALGCTIAALILSVLWGYLGFTMNITSLSYICTDYLTFKIQYNIVFIYNAIFIGGSVSLLSQLIALICLIYLIMKYCKSNDQHFQEFTQSAIRLLYISFSLGLLGVCICVGYYGTFIIEEGIFCLYYIYFDWLIIGGLFAVALLFLLICWFILICFWNYKKHKFDEIPPPSVQKSSQIQQPQNMIGLFQTIKEVLKKQSLLEPRQIKQPLLEEEIEDEEQDQQVEGNKKQKLQIMTFDEYKKSLWQQQSKEYQDQQIINELMRQQDQKKSMKQEDQKIAVKMQEERTKKQDYRDVALSPDDPNFDKIFQDEQSQKQKQQSQTLVVSEPKKQYFPANFVPSNQSEKMAFQKYKQKLLQKYKQNSTFNNESILFKVSQYDKKPRNRHPQNIEGGRSKKIMHKYLKQCKRPLRDESIYLRTFDPRQNQVIDSQNQNIQQQSEGSSYKSAQFKLNEPITKQKNEEKQENLAVSSKNPLFLIIPQEIEPQVLYFQKEKTKSNMRKKLFEQTQSKQLTSQTFSSTLGALVKGVQDAAFKNKVNQLRQKRNEGTPTNKASRRSQKLIESIRSKFI